MIYKFTVEHQPMGAPRMTRRDKWKQRDCVVRYRAFKDAIRLEFMRLRHCPLPGENVLSLSWVATFEPPQSWSKKRKAEAIGELHRSKPDRDNIDKAVLDALFEDDSGIAAGHIEKRWGVAAKIEIVIEVRQ